MEIKNVRQIGKIGNGIRVYEEDYVRSYIRKLNTDKNTGIVYAVLAGRYIRQPEGENSLFIYGAIEVAPEIKDGVLNFDEQVWTDIYEDMKKYFGDGEIAGWCAVGSMENNILEGIFEKTHIENFSGKDKVFIKFDTFEREEEFYYLDDGKLREITGYFVYYEKNEQMQEYMMSTSKNVIMSEDFDDKVVKQFRETIRKKESIKKENEESKQLALRNLYITGAGLIMIVIAIGVTALNSSRKVDGLEKTLENIENSLNEKNNGNIFNEPAKDVLSNNGEKLDNTNSSNKTNNNGNLNDKDLDNKEDTNKGNASNQNDSNEGDKNNSNKDNSDKENNNEENDKENDEQETNVKENDNKDDKDNNNKDTDNANENDSNNKNDKDNNEKENDKNNNDKSENDKNSDADKKETDKEDSKETSTVINEKADYKIYIVKEGDTLAGICYKIYGTIKPMEEIKKLNDIQNENKIYIGQELLYPDK